MMLMITLHSLADAYGLCRQFRRACTASGDCKGRFSQRSLPRLGSSKSCKFRWKPSAAFLVYMPPG